MYSWLEGDVELRCDLMEPFDAAYKLHENDWVDVEGSFAGVNPDGHVSIHCTKFTKAIRPANDNY